MSYIQLSHCKIHQNIMKKLINIASGSVASAEIKDDNLIAQKKKKKKLKCFQSVCSTTTYLQAI